MNWYLAALRKYATFSGRARRKEYWMFSLFNLIAMAALFLIGIAISENTAIFLLCGYILFILIPSISVTVRRLHDAGFSGGFYLLNFIPYIGGLIVLVLMCLDSKGENEYGPNPKVTYD